MTSNPIHFTTRRGLVTLMLLLLTIALMVSACGGAAVPLAAKSAPSVAGATSAPIAAKPAANVTPTPQAQNSKSGIDCAATANANLEFGMALAQLVNLTPDTNYAGLTDPASPVYVDFTKLHGDLNTLAMLPDPTDAAELTFGKPSDSIAYFRQLLDVAGSDIKAQGKPFKDTTATGQKVIGLDSPWMTQVSTFAMAMEKACPNFSLPTDTPPSNKVTNQIGQTATLGDLQVTLDKVATVPGELGNLPTSSGMGFVFVSVTIENTGKTALATNSVTRAFFQDAAGKQYYFEPYALMLQASHPLDGEIAPGKKISGTIGYQLPTQAGDLIWIVTDNAGNRAAFAVKASDIVAEGVPIGEATAAAMQTSVAATTAAIIDMANNADATAAAVTANPGTPEPTETPGPTDTPEPTETPSP
jgi:Domain of unknown function (DUF4352)